MSNVKLAVRVRPMSAREKEQKKTSIVNVENDHTIAVTNLKVGVCGAGDSRTRVRRYKADYCLDSSLPASHPNHASQEKVFNSVGTAALDALRANRAVCILAYGQSASGKTHTVLGAGGSEGGGLVPRLCDVIATKDLRQVPTSAGLGETEDNNVEVFVSYLEIYNEKVRDLLAEENEGNRDLHVRGHPRRGPYLQNVSVTSVRGRVALRALVSRGTRARRAAPTSHNPASSRSHAVLIIARARGPGAPVLHAVDLAGSEKASPSGAALSRQKEEANINRSLVALGNVIAALASARSSVRGCGRGWGGGAYVPYRGSALTWILKDSFGAGALTFMIATVSPSSCCYSETVNTLRWAARARLIPAALPQSTGHAHTRALREQIDDIHGALQRAGIRYISETKSLIVDERQLINENSTVSNQTCNRLRIMDALIQSLQKDAVCIQSTTLSAATGSSEQIASNEKPSITLQNINNESEPKVNELFGPCLRRTGSGHDLVTVLPKKNEERQYSSHEVLTLNNKVKEDDSQHTSNESISTSSTQASANRSMRLSRKEQDDNSEKELFNKSDSCSKAAIVYQPENKRADIVASVTQRLYTKNKRKDEPNSPKSEGIVEKKNTEPLSELKICTNARQRLLELSQRALRTRRRMGISTYTQTICNVVRMKDVAIDVQLDLEPFYAYSNNSVKLYQNVACETYPMTPRSKEASVGPESGSIKFSDKGINTEYDFNTMKLQITKSCGVMTDNFVDKSTGTTQTQYIESPKINNSHSFTKYLNPKHEHSDNINNGTPTIVNINISHQLCANDTDDISDDSIESVPTIAPPNGNMTPDLLSNHNSTDHDTVTPSMHNPRVLQELALESKKIFALNISLSEGKENISQCFGQSLGSKELTKVVDQRNNETVTMQHQCNVKASYDINKEEVEENGWQSAVDRVPCCDSSSESGRTAAPERSPHAIRVVRTVPSPQPCHTSQQTDSLIHDTIITECSTSTSLAPACTNSNKGSDNLFDIKSVIKGYNNNSITPYNHITSSLKENVCSRNESLKKSVSFIDRYKDDQKLKQSQDTNKIPKNRCSVDEAASKIKLRELKSYNNSDRDSGYEIIAECNRSETYDSTPGELQPNRSQVGMPRSRTSQYARPIMQAMDKFALEDTTYTPVYQERSISHDTDQIKKPFASNLTNKMSTKSSYSSSMRGTPKDDAREANIEPPSFSHVNYAEEVDHLARFKEKRLFFEEKFHDFPSCIHSRIDKRFPNIYCDKSYDALEYKVLQSCDRLENCVKKHEKLLDCAESKRQSSGKRFNTNRNGRGGFSDTGSINSPSEYLKKLLDLRREIVSVSRNDESASHSFHGFL